MQARRLRSQQRKVALKPAKRCRSLLSQSLLSQNFGHIKLMLATAALQRLEVAPDLPQSHGADALGERERIFSGMYYVDAGKF